MDSIAFRNIGPVDGGPVRFGIFSHGSVSPRGRIPVAANNFIIRAEAKFGHIAFPEIFFQGFEKGHIDFIAAGRAGDRNHRCGKRAGARNNAVDSIHDGLGKTIRGLGIKVIFTVFRIGTVG